MNYYNLDSSLLNNYIKNFPLLSSNVQNIKTTEQQENLMNLFEIPFLYNSHSSPHYIYSTYIDFLLNLKLEDPSKDSAYFMDFLYNNFSSVFSLFRDKIKNSDITESDKLIFDYLSQFQTHFKNIPYQAIIDSIHISSISKNFPQFEAQIDYSTPDKFIIQNLSHYHAFIALKKDNIILSSESNIDYLEKNSSPNIFYSSDLINSFKPTFIDIDDIAYNIINEQQVSTSSHFKLKSLLLDSSSNTQEDFFNCYDKIISNDELPLDKKLLITYHFFYILCNQINLSLKSHSDFNYCDNTIINNLQKLSSHPFVLEHHFFSNSHFLDLFFKSNVGSQYKNNIFYELNQFLEKNKNSSINEYYCLDKIKEFLHPVNLLKIKNFISFFEKLSRSENLSSFDPQKNSDISIYLPVVFPFLSMEYKQNLLPLLNSCLSSLNIKNNYAEFPFLKSISLVDFLPQDNNNSLLFIHNNIHLFNNKPSLNNLSYLELLKNSVDTIISLIDKTHINKNQLNSDENNVPEYFFEHLDTCAKNPLLKQIVFKNNLNNSFIFEKENLPLLHSKLLSFNTETFKSSYKILTTLKYHISICLTQNPSVFQSNFLLDEILDISSKSFTPSSELSSFGINIPSLINDGNLHYIEPLLKIEPNFISDPHLLSLIFKHKLPILTHELRESILNPNTLSNLTYETDFKLNPLENFNNVSSQVIFNTFNQDNVFLWSEILKEPDWVKLFPEDIKQDPIFWANTLNSLIDFYGKDDSSVISSKFMNIVPLDIKNSPSFLKDFFSNISNNYTFEHCLQNIPSSWITRTSDFVNLVELLEKNISDKKFTEQSDLINKYISHINPHFKILISSFIEKTIIENEHYLNLNLIEKLSSEINQYYLKDSILNKSSNTNSSRKIKF